MVLCVKWLVDLSQGPFWGIISVMIGGFITWVVARIYYVKAGKELKEESRKVRVAIGILGESLNSGPTVDKILINEERIPTGLQKIAGVNFSGEGTLTVNAEVVKGKT